MHEDIATRSGLCEANSQQPRRQATPTSKILNLTGLAITRDKCYKCRNPFWLNSWKEPPLQNLHTRRQSWIELTVCYPRLISQIIQTDFQNPTNLLQNPPTFSLEQYKSVLAHVGSVSLSLMSYSLLCCFSGWITPSLNSPLTTALNITFISSLWFSLFDTALSSVWSVTQEQLFGDLDHQQPSLSCPHLVTWPSSISPIFCLQV
jgi:hypothetical protein